jgi:hypothetical protein
MKTPSMPVGLRMALRFVLLGLILLSAGCQGRPPPITSNAESLQREADMLRKQNEDMIKKR